MLTEDNTLSLDFESDGGQLSFYQHGCDDHRFVVRVYHSKSDSSRAIIMDKNFIPEIIKFLEQLNGGETCAPKS